MSSDDGQTEEPVDVFDEIGTSKKLKQSPEDKRKRNYIAVRKHRQQLKDTLEQCPITLVELTKELEQLSTQESRDLELLAEFEALVQSAKKKMPPRKPKVVVPPPDTGPSTSYASRRRESPEDEIEHDFKRPRRVFPHGMPPDLLPQSPMSLPSPSFTSPLLQPLVNPLFSPFNLLPSSYLQSPLINPFLMSSPAAPAPTPLQSPVQYQPIFPMRSPELLQQMITTDYLQTSTVRTDPIAFTRDNIDYLWKMCNDQLR